jgi:hypothetical protein
MSEPDPVPQELAALFEAERSAPASDARARELVRVRLASLVPVASGKAAAGATTLLTGTGKIIAVVAISIGVGAAAIGVARRSESASTPRPPSQLVEVAPVGAETIRDHMATREEPAAAIPVPAAAIPVPAAVVQAPPSETSLITSAWSAFSAGDANRALELTNDAERWHPHGALIEEREALRIRAFSKLGRAADAESAAQKFLSQYPHSVHRKSIEHAIQGDRP